MDFPPFRTIVYVAGLFSPDTPILEIVGRGDTQTEADEMAEAEVALMNCIVLAYYRCQLIDPAPASPFSTLLSSQSSNTQIYLQDASSNLEPKKLYLVDNSLFTGQTIDTTEPLVQDFETAWRDADNNGGYTIVQSLKVI